MPSDFSRNFCVQDSVLGFQSVYIHVVIGCIICGYSKVIKTTGFDLAQSKARCQIK